jgi:hypothetical protein
MVPFWRCQGYRLGTSFPLTAVVDWLVLFLVNSSELSWFCVGSPQGEDMRSHRRGEGSIPGAGRPRSVGGWCLKDEDSDGEE